MTAGVTEETPDGMSLEKIDAIIEAIRYERYQWLPARRTSIPKKQGKQRPLGMPVWSDKLVQEVLRSSWKPTLNPNSQTIHMDFDQNEDVTPRYERFTTRGMEQYGSSREISRSALID